MIYQNKKMNSIDAMQHARDIAKKIQKNEKDAERQRLEDATEHNLEREQVENIDEVTLQNLDFNRNNFKLLNRSQPEENEADRSFTFKETGL